jgi:serine/threonine protein kinase
MMPCRVKSTCTSRTSFGDSHDHVCMCVYVCVCMYVCLLCYTACTPCQDIADTGGCQDEGVLANIAVQGLAGLDFLHACNQIHRDVKPANLLINLNGDVKVSDLGILRQIDIDKDIREESKRSTPSKEDIMSGAGEGKEGGTVEVRPAATMHRAHTFVGTTTYMSPERIDGQDYSYPCDIWSFGLSLLTLTLGRLPLDTKGGFWGILQSVRDSPPPTLPADGE